jgi:hypothetical protein
VGVDYTRSVRFKTALQGMVDAASIAGTTVYSSSGQAAAAQTATTDFINLEKTKLTDATINTTTVTANASAINSTTTGYAVTVTVKAQLDSSFLSLFWQNLAVGATATAQKKMLITVTLGLGPFASDAWDKNTISWYTIPSTSDANSYVPDDSDLHPIYSNASGWNNPPSTQLTIGLGDKIGFVLENITGGNRSYGANGYGGTGRHMFYSNIPNLSKYVYPAGSNNCSLQVQTVTDPEHMPSPTTGRCLSSNSTNSAPSCAEVGGQTLQFGWNDMGGGSDDKDYNDAVYTLTCPSTTSAVATNVTLIN